VTGVGYTSPPLAERAGRELPDYRAPRHAEGAPVTGHPSWVGVAGGRPREKAGRSREALALAARPGALREHGRTRGRCPEMGVRGRHGTSAHACSSQVREHARPIVREPIRCHVPDMRDVAQPPTARTVAVAPRGQADRSLSRFRWSQGLVQPAALAQRVPDAEGAADEGVDVAAAGGDVAPGGGEVDGDARSG
jgi:hypothetical protein